MNSKNITTVKEEYKQAFFHFKGLIDVCSSSDWNPRLDNERMTKEWLKVYVGNVDIISHLPTSFHGVVCNYYVVPDGLHPGCD